MAADGRVEISVNLDNKEAEKKLSDLRRSIERTAKSIESTGGKKAAITEQLEQARQEAAATAKEIEELNAQKIENEATLSGRTGDVSLEEFEARKQAQAETTYQLKEQEKLQASQNSNIAKLEEKERALTAQIEQQTASLEKQKSEAGEVERVIASQASSAMPQLAASAEAVSKSMRKGFKSILKWGFGIRSAFILIRRLRSAVIEGVKAFAQQDEETRNNINGLKSSLSTLKASWGAAFAPILNAVAPILKTLISWLTAAANAIQRFFAILGGKGSYKKAIQNNENLANSYGGAGGAAEKAEKQILGFDEINKLNAESSGGGGGGGGAEDALEYVEEAIDALDGSFLSNLALSIKDVLFTWDDLNPEQIAEKIIAGLGGLLGLALGIALGLGPGGVVLLTIAGVALGLVIDALIFDHDGKLGKSEIMDMVILAINALLGGVLGFAMTRSFKGALIGATIGAGLWVALKAIRLKKGNALNDVITSGLLAIINGIVGAGIGFYLGGGVPGAIFGAIVGFGLTVLLQGMKLKAEKSDAFYQTELGKQVQAVNDKIKDVMEVDEDLTVRINSITGEVDSATMVNLGAAQQLIDDIFNLDAKENKTSAEAEILKQKIEALNDLGLPGIQLAFDETTCHVTQTRAEVQGLLDDLLRQYEIEAMKEAYIDAYKAQYEATQNVTNATDAAEQAAQNYTTAMDNLTQAQSDYNAALAEFNEFKTTYAGYWTNGELTDDPMKKALDAARDAYVEAQQAAQETKTAAEDAETALTNSLSTYDTAKEKVEDIANSLADMTDKAHESGENTIKDFSEGIEENTPDAEEAMKTAGSKALEALHTVLDEHSPSGETKKSGENAMEGFALGVESGQSRIVDAMTTAMQAAKAVVEEMVQQMISVWRTDWGRPMIHLPVFSLSGMFDFRTGRAPQVTVSDWLWMAKGGIVDGATLIGAGEDGKEAIVPLERNTEWINMVARGLVDNITSNNRLADYVSNLPLPSIAQGQIVPPRALSNGGSMFTDGDIQRLVSGITAAFTQDSGEQSIKLYLDGKQIAETVTRHQRRMERGMA